MKFVYIVSCTDISKFENTSAPAIWKDKLCTTAIDVAINKANSLLDKGYDVSVRTWTEEDDFETCVICQQENAQFIESDEIITWSEKK